MIREPETPRPLSARSSILRWALAGAIWGLVSFLVTMVFWGPLFTYEGILYRLASRPLILLPRLLLPSWWALRIVRDSGGFLEGSQWAYYAFVVGLSVALGALAALGLRLVVHGAKRGLRALRGRPGA